MNLLERLRSLFPSPRIAWAALLVSSCLVPRVGAVSYVLTVSTSGPRSPSVVYSSNPLTGIDCGSTSTACSATFAAGSTVTLTNATASTMAFAGWGGDGCLTNSRTCRVLMSGNRTATATYGPRLRLSLWGNGLGTVSDSSGTIVCSSTGGACGRTGAATQAYFSGTVVKLSTTADPGSTFVGWSGACSGAGPCSVTMGSYSVVVATFSSAGPFTILVSTGGTGRGRVTSSPPGINCGSTSTACSLSVAADSSLTLTAYAVSGSTFAGWAGAGCASTGTCVVLSTSAYQGVSGLLSPSAWFY